MTTGLRDRWASGGTALGAWISLRDPIVAETAASLGFDYVCIDLQHGLNDYDGMANALAAMARTGATPLVRVPWNEPGIIGRALDAGAAGVIVPMVNSVDEAQRAASACHYWPTGTRSFGPITVGTRGGFAGIETANEQVLCIPMIETREAVEQIDDILGVPGISAVYVGPADLAITYGLRPGLDQTDDDWNAAIATVVASCAAHGVIAGVHGAAPLAAKRGEQGFRMITVTTDLGSVGAGFGADLRTSREATGG
ncbi:MAG: aldolase/citrate lyase family protein [Ilumatobacteraceae bacterium]